MLPLILDEGDKLKFLDLVEQVILLILRKKRVNFEDKELSISRQNWLFTEEIEKLETRTVMVQTNVLQ